MIDKNNVSNCLSCNKAYIKEVDTQLYCSLKCRRKAENNKYYETHRNKAKIRSSEIYNQKVINEEKQLSTSLEEYKEDSIKNTIQGSPEREDDLREYRFFSLSHRKNDIDRILKEHPRFKELSYRFTVYVDKDNGKFLCRTMLSNVLTRADAQRFWRIAQAKKNRKI